MARTAGLGIYRKKRRFGITAEPKGKVARKRGHAFVIQKHDATRLHYDLRLELDGVMKSWAVTRGPSLVPGEKRLAVQVEDHPIDYNKFEGTIPKGQYGGGTVMIWDRGTWEAQHDPHKGLAKGHLDFTLNGQKLQGGWHLVRMHRRPGEKRDNWLLIKQTDDAARTGKQKDILDEKPLSVASGRTMDEIATRSKKVWHSRPKKRQPASGRELLPHDLCAEPANRLTTRASGARQKAPCPRLSRHAWRRWSTKRPQVATGSTRSSSMATACRRGSTTARSSCSPARGSTGRRNSRASPKRSPDCRRGRLCSTVNS